MKLKLIGSIKTMSKTWQRTKFTWPDLRLMDHEIKIHICEVTIESTMGNWGVLRARVSKTAGSLPKEQRDMLQHFIPREAERRDWAGVMAFFGPERGAHGADYSDQIKVSFRASKG